MVVFSLVTVKLQMIARENDGKVKKAPTLIPDKYRNAMAALPFLSAML
jgi:hypothetical protein